ncbi:T9SS type A sorting domain-containing protein [Dyadobacter aurulentus]|uniref:T9SS type A sorting domain-containing protein n=1 Tax=Dyadobacter sp. UC 10 TaxID=2605428 RepID=UPI0011F3136B|nr:T9SS type A sorting domain-containing protein [Dyadobacter sp. UC 10]KAA0989581.1 T9SS type A sorting domain-containing protein [Dyadobacter sp. UC 10]
MKNFTVLVMLLMLSLGLGGPGFGMTGGDCGCKDSENALKNGSFESGTNNWSKTNGTDFAINQSYNMCGEKNGVINGSGTVYQVVDLAGGSEVDLSIYGGTHKPEKNHQFKLLFYTSGNQLIEGNDNQVVIDMNYKVTNSKLKQYTASITAPANAAKVVLYIVSGGDYFKFDVACMTVTPPAPADCGCPDSENALKNGSFESGTANWSKIGDTNFGTDTKYSQCGYKNGVINGAGTIYQEVAVTQGADVSVKVFGGTHDSDKTHEFWLTFYNSSGQKIDGNHNVVVKMNYEVTQYHKLQEYTLSGKAPSGAAKVRLSAYSNGNYFKVDVACMKISTPPPSDCGCPDDQNAIKNGSFESGTDHWSKFSGTNFISEPPYSVCGYKNGLITGSGTIYQEVNLTPGSKVTLKVFGGTHDTNLNHEFKLEFYTSAGVLIPIPVDGNNTKQMDYKVTQQHQLQEYSLSATAPIGAGKVRFSVISGGNYFKIDGVCMGITPPPTPTCETCNNNKLTNASFEDGMSNWSKTGNVVADATIAVCGVKSLILSGESSFSQNVTMLPSYGNTVTLIFWAAVLENRNQKVEIVFLDGSSKVLGTLTQEVDKLVNSDPWGMQRYTLAGAVPPGTEVVRVQGSQSENYLAIDGTCLTFSGPPLPVTLSSFNAKKEGSTTSLAWTTTFESNSDHFDVQHSEDGKKWTILATIQAQGESTDDVTYTYTHTNPFAVNLYRLKMVDADGTFAYSSIKSVKFSGEEQMRIYPNPVVDRIKFDSKQQISNVKVYNQNGVLVLNTKPDSANEVDLTRLVQGTYFVKVNDGLIARKILVVR